MELSRVRKFCAFARTLQALRISECALLTCLIAKTAIVEPLLLRGKTA
jgi:hypothetical protein